MQTLNFIYHYHCESTPILVAFLEKNLLQIMHYEHNFINLAPYYKSCIEPPLMVVLLICVYFLKAQPNYVDEENYKMIVAHL